MVSNVPQRVTCGKTAKMRSPRSRTSRQMGRPYPRIGSSTCQYSCNKILYSPLGGPSRAGAASQRASSGVDPDAPNIPTTTPKLRDSLLPEREGLWRHEADRHRPFESRHRRFAPRHSIFSSPEAARSLDRSRPSASCRCEATALPANDCTVIVMTSTTNIPWWSWPLETYAYGNSAFVPDPHA